LEEGITTLNITSTDSRRQTPICIHYAFKVQRKNTPKKNYKNSALQGSMEQRGPRKGATERKGNSERLSTTVGRNKVLPRKERVSAITQESLLFTDCEEKSRRRSKEDEPGRGKQTLKEIRSVVRRTSH